MNIFTKVNFLHFALILFIFYAACPFAYIFTLPSDELYAHARVYYNVEIFKVIQPFTLLIWLAAPPHELI
jgi:hypothetical protein